MQAAFVDIGQEKNTFIHAQDILPKVDITKEPVKTANIKDIIKTGSSIIVQVKRDSTNKKGARVSTHISLPGRYIVLMPNTNIITISQKIEENKERERLIELVKKNLPENIGAIIRTSAINKKEEEIQDDIKTIMKKWKEIQTKVQNSENAPQLLYESDSITRKILIDMIDQKIDEICVNKNEIKEEVEKILEDMKLGKSYPQIKKVDNAIEENEIEKQIEKISKRKVWLKCGGFITIDQTEALTAIDVNSGKYIGKEDLENTVFTVNKEASIEIAKQLRLRDLEGIIIIDYIDMKDRENKDKILEILKNNLKQDRSKTQVIGFTQLNLLEMTRKHMYSSIEENNR